MRWRGSPSPSRRRPTRADRRCFPDQLVGGRRGQRLRERAAAREPRCRRYPVHGWLHLPSSACCRAAADRAGLEPLLPRRRRGRGHAHAGERQTTSASRRSPVSSSEASRARGNRAASRARRTRLQPVDPRAAAVARPPRADAPEMAPMRTPRRRAVRASSASGAFASTCDPAAPGGADLAHRVQQVSLSRP